MLYNSRAHHGGLWGGPFFKRGGGGRDLAICAPWQKYCLLLSLSLQLLPANPHRIIALLLV